MSNSVKMVVLVRSDPKMRRGKLISLITEASTKFFTDNNESDEPGVIHLKTSLEEAQWLKEGQPKIIGWSTENHMRDIVFRSEFRGISSYVLKDGEKSESGGDSIICVALGPGDTEDILNLVGKIKLI